MARSRTHARTHADWLHTSWFTMCFSVVVLPAPRKPHRTVTGVAAGCPDDAISSPSAPAASLCLWLLSLSLAALSVSVFSVFPISSFLLAHRRRQSDLAAQARERPGPLIRLFSLDLDSSVSTSPKRPSIDTADPNESFGVEGSLKSVRMLQVLSKPRQGNGSIESPGG